MNRLELIEKITQKKEFSQLPKKDVEIAFEKFSKKDLNDWQRIKLVRQFLRKIYTSFSSRKIFSEPKKKKESEWYLMKHKSTKERFEYYGNIYERIFKNLKEVSVIDLGAGINGLSFLNEKIKTKISYVGIEAVGQFVDLMNDSFKKDRFNGKAIHESLFEVEKIKKIISEQKKPRVVLLFKVIDSLEVVKRDYSKELLKEIMPLSDKVVISFATRSLGNRKKFSVTRNWLLNFIKENFEITDDFEVFGERYIIFRKAN